MTEKILKATHGSPAHPLRINNLEMPCYVLEDGKRVLVQTEMIKSLDMSPGGNPKRKGEGDRLARFVTGKILKTFIPDRLLEATVSPIKFRTPHGSLAYGYEASVLADICEAVLAARQAGVLQEQQLHIAERCEILVRGFARVGIIALVDEATGYQKERERNELQKILEKYIATELLPWVKTFPDEYYEQLFRLMEWQYNPLSVKRPKYVGKLTNKIVYEKLPPGVLEDLRRLNPVTEKGYRKDKHFQHLSPEVGKEHLEKHLTEVIVLMRISPNWRTFEKHLERAFPSHREEQIEVFEKNGNNLDDLDEL